MKRVQPTSGMCRLICVTVIAWSSGASLAQDPVFNFGGAASPADLFAHVHADDLITTPWWWDEDTQQTFGFVSPFTFSGGTVDWGNTLNILAQDELVSASANPLVRLNGDGTQRISIAWKANNILSVGDTSLYDGRAYSDVYATFYLTLDNLIPFQTYTIFYQWTAEGFADGEHEAFQEDPEFAAGWLELYVGGLGPGLIFDEAVDNVGGAPLSIFRANSGVLDVYSNSTSLPLLVDVFAMADSTFREPFDSDLIWTIFRGTLNLTVVGLIPGIIITEVVDGDLPGGTPKFVELTNCGCVDWIFGPDDLLAIYFNGSSTAGTAVSLDGIALAVGESYVIASALNNGGGHYFDAYGDYPDLLVNLSFGNGNDVYSLEYGPDVIDTYGIIGVNGTDQDWFYEDSYAHSKPCRAPNLGIFDANDWRIGGPHALAGTTDPQRIALLQTYTTPKTHECFCEMVVTILDDNFETDQGWTAVNLGATAGDWERGVPVNDPNWPYDPVSDSDGSGQCYLTENQLGDSDVDNGAVALVSPRLDMSIGGITISYDYYLYLTDTTGSVDVLLVEIDSNDGAGPWTEIARHDTNGGLSWRNHVITEADLHAAGVTLTPTMRLRFTANDAYPESINESGLDAVLITGFDCRAPCFGDLTGDRLIGLADLAQLLSNYGTTSGARYTDGDLDGDDDVDLSDLATLLALYGTTCP